MTIISENCPRWRPGMYLERLDTGRVAWVLHACPRCGGHHVDPEVHPFPEPVLGKYRQWAVCPETNCPVLLPDWVKNWQSLVTLARLGKLAGTG